MSLDELGIGDRDERADTEHTGENSNWESFHVRCVLSVCDRVSHTSFGESNLTVGHPEHQ